MKWIACCALLAFAAPVMADTYYLDAYGNVIGVQRSAPVARSYSQQPKRLRYVQSCPDGSCGGGFSGMPPVGGCGPQGCPTGGCPTGGCAPESEQDITSYRPKQTRKPASTYRYYR